MREAGNWTDNEDPLDGSDAAELRNRGQAQGFHRPNLQTPFQPGSTPLGSCFIHPICTVINPSCALSHMQPEGRTALPVSVRQDKADRLENPLIKCGV